MIINRYFSWYLGIMFKAKAENRTKENHEIHHVLPKSLGGRNDTGNRVFLTYREHFLCHWLLTKCTQGEVKRKMCFALHLMRKKQNSELRVVSSWQYVVGKNSNRLAMIGNNIGSGNKGKSKSTETRLRMSLAAQNRSLEHRKKISQSQKGRVRSAEEKAKQSAAMKGRKNSDSHNLAIARGQVGRKHSDATKTKMRESYRRRTFAFTQ